MEDNDESASWWDRALDTVTEVGGEYARQRLGQKQKPVNNAPVEKKPKIDVMKIAMIAGAIAGVIGLVLLLRRK